MNLKRHFQQAVINLSTAKLRSFLAVLGILVGTAAVVALLSSGKLATEKALAQFKALGTDLLSLSVYQNTSTVQHNGQDTISLEQWRSIPERIPAIVKLAPYSTAYQAISFEGKTLNGAIIGADESLADIIHIRLSEGHFVSFVETFEHFCVIGSALAEELKAYTLDNPIGKQVRIGKALYTIIGVAKPWKENGFFNEDINRAIIIPISGMMLVNKDSKINNAVLLLDSTQMIDDVIEEIKQTINQLAPDLNLFVRSAKQIIASMESQGRIFTMLLAVIGGISLVVGGIGVMNVMLVAVSERKKEIGVRKALGAKNREIQALFLVESVILSLSGGFLGVLLGLALTWMIALFNHWSFTLYIVPPLAGFAVSVVTGIFFGFYPARRASLLEPMASLRADL
ncbi:ABC transporter permease [Legionella impletisoli]|uniref:ABC transporter permease n=2 Tax=Bacteria TaxID=2 RepID=A0A917JSK2_9GAMM|nr:ABC transporter permease [Legionella impletisoli]GGI84927.1 ABC transporter permease [Legionella impletisoli]